jgi:hypothetical protein
LPQAGWWIHFRMDFFDPPPRLLPFRMLRDILFMVAACPSWPGADHCTHLTPPVFFGSIGRDGGVRHGFQR